mgnify:CR=1 FL=1
MKRVKAKPRSSSALHPYWHKFIENVQQTRAIALIETYDLVENTEHGKKYFNNRNIAGRSPPLFKFFSEQKSNYPCDVLLLENGKFFDTHGIDALMLVEHCNVVSFGNTLRAGIHSDNMQRSCDQLLEAGLTVVIFEQIGTGKNANTTRIFLQKISPLQPTYFGRHLTQNMISEHVRSGVPLVAIQEDSKDTFKFAHVDLQSRECIVQSGLTKGCVLTLLLSHGAEKDYTWSTTNLFPHKHLLPPQVSFPDLFLIAACARHPALGISVKDIKTVVRTRASDRPRPLYSSTLRELGMLQKHGHVPNLVDFCLAKNASAPSKQKMLEWLSNPPTVENACRVKAIVHMLSRSIHAFPKCSTLNPKKFLPLINRRKLSIAACHELKDLIEGTAQLGKFDIFPELFQLAASENFIHNLPQSYFEKTMVGIRKVFGQLLCQIEDEKTVVSELEKWNFRNLRAIHGFSFSNFTKELENVRRTFLLHQASFPTTLILSKQNLSLELAKGANRIYICAKKKSSRTTASWMAVTWGKKNKILSGMFTSKNIEETYSRYDDAIEKLNSAAKTLLVSIATRLDKYQRFFVLCSSICNSFETLLSHTRACAKTWVPTTLSKTDSISLKGLKPYWIPDAIGNDISLQKQIILTGANASGKSTFIRSVISASLLGTCGLLVPANEACIPLLTSFFLRISAKDDPARQKSSFQIEIEDIAMLEKEVDHRSLLGIDEAFRSTQPRIATSLSVQTLQHLARTNTKTIFASHLVYPLSKLLPIEQFFHINTNRKFCPGPCFESNAYAVALSSGLSPHFLGIQSTTTVTTLEQVLRIAEDILKTWCPHTLRIQIEYTQQPPLLNSSVVYILHTPNNMFYVGESDTFSTRIAQHRKRQDRKHADAFVYKVDNKSIAKKIETLIGKKLFENCIPLLSSNDNSHVNFGSY